MREAPIQVPAEAEPSARALASPSSARRVLRCGSFPAGDSVMWTLHLPDFWKDFQEFIHIIYKVKMLAVPFLFYKISHLRTPFIRQNNRGPLSQRKSFIQANLNIL